MATLSSGPSVVTMPDRRSRAAVGATAVLAAGALAFYARDALPGAGAPTRSSGGSCDGVGVGADERCGATSSASCCATEVVPGGRFLRAYDGSGCTDAGFEAEVSAFALDRYEVTVGRFRRFLDAGGGLRGTAPAVGAGAHPTHPETGWRDEWDAELELDRPALEHALACGPAATWTDESQTTDDRPVNCITWFEAFAFCIWDGGRLPTEAEWNFAAAGGPEHRERPWAATPIERARAVYGEASPFPVGSCSPEGDGRWGHADLVGNVWEWTLDANDTDALLPREGAMPCSTAGLPTPCVDCVAPGTRARVLRGAGFGMPAIGMRGAIRRADPPAAREHVFGFRCARAATGAPPLVRAPATDGGVLAHGAPVVGPTPPPVLRGFAMPHLDLEHARTLDLHEIAHADTAVPATSILLVDVCVWDADTAEIVDTLEAGRAELRARGIEPVILVAEGARRGQPADLIDVANLARRHSLTVPIAADEAGTSPCDRAILVAAEGLTSLGIGLARDAITPEAPFWRALSPSERGTERER